jgi:hypothetical protein
MKKNKNLMRLDQFIDKEIGLKGSKNSDKFEKDYNTFKLILNIDKMRNGNFFNGYDKSETKG